MVFVLDQNCSRKEKLRTFFEDGHFVIITDDFFLEPFKAVSPYEILEHNFRIIRDYQNQIMVALDIGELMNLELSLRQPLDFQSITNIDKTKWLIQLLNMNSQQFRNELNQKKQDAVRRIQNMENFGENFIRGMAAKTNAAMKAQNSRKEYQTDKAKRISDIAQASIDVLKQIIINKFGSLSGFEWYSDNFSLNFRYLFSYLWRVTDWSIQGGFLDAKGAIKGDPYDIKYVTISSYYDGILSDETWLSECRDDLLLLQK